MPLILLTATVFAIGAASRLALPYGSPLGAALDSDGERNVLAGFSALLLLGGGTVGLGLLHRRPLYGVFGAGMLVLGVDEFVSAHEFVERITGVDWQLLFAPLGLVGAVVVVLVLRRARADAPPAAVLLVAALGCWVVSQVLELVQWDGDRPRTGYGAMMLTEEALELAASVGILLALLVLRAALRRAAA